MAKTNAVLLVSPMGHDVDRVSKLLALWMRKSGLFEVEIVGDCPYAHRTIDGFFADEPSVEACGLFVFICPDNRFSEASRRRLEKAVSGGKPVLFCHGLHPAFRGWPEAEKMIGLLWRDTAMHGDFGYCDVRMEKEHPITEGVENFRTKEELFCALTNVWNVPLEVLVSAYSDENLISRHGSTARATGNRCLPWANTAKAERWTSS